MRTVHRTGTLNVGDASSAEQIADLTLRTVSIAATTRARITDTSVTLTTHRAITIDDTLLICSLAHVVHAALAKQAIHVRDAHARSERALTIVTHETKGAVDVGLTQRRLFTSVVHALLEGRTIGITRAELTCRRTQPIRPTNLIGRTVNVTRTELWIEDTLAPQTLELWWTVSVQHACRDREALVVYTLLDAVAVEVIEAEVLDRLAGVVHTLLTKEAVIVTITPDRWLTDLTNAELVRTTVDITLTLADELTLEVQATLARTALIVEATTWDWHTESELADLAISAVAVTGTVWRRQRDTHASDALEPEAAIGVALTAAGCFADVVLADLTGERTVIVVLTGERRCTAARVTCPERGTVGLIDAGRGHTVTEVTALGDITVSVDAAVGARLAEEAVTECAGGTVGVVDALAEVHTLVTDALESRLAIHIGGALHIRDTGTRDRLALLRGRAVRVSATSSRDHTAVAVITDLARVALIIEAAIAGEHTAPVDAGLVIGTVRIDLTLGRRGDARAVDAALTRETIEVIEAREQRLTGACYTLETWLTTNTVAQVDALATEVVADLVRRTLVVIATVAHEETGVVQADLTRPTVHILHASCRRHALAHSAHLVDAAISIGATLCVEHTAARDTDLARATLEVIEALGRIGDTAAIDAELVRGAIEVCTAAGRRDTGSRITHLAIRTLGVVATLEEEASAVNAGAAKTAVSVDDALWLEITEAAIALEARGAVDITHALTEVRALTIFAKTAFPAVLIERTLG